MLNLLSRIAHAYPTSQVSIESAELSIRYLQIIVQINPLIQSVYSGLYYHLTYHVHFTGALTESIQDYIDVPKSNHTHRYTTSQEGNTSVTLAPIA